MVVRSNGSIRLSHTLTACKNAISFLILCGINRSVQWQSNDQLVFTNGCWYVVVQADLWRQSYQCVSLSQKHDSFLFEQEKTKVC